MTNHTSSPIDLNSASENELVERLTFPLDLPKESLRYGLINPSINSKWCGELIQKWCNASYRL